MKVRTDYFFAILPCFLIIALNKEDARVQKQDDRQWVKCLQVEVSFLATSFPVGFTPYLRFLDPVRRFVDRVWSFWRVNVDSKPCLFSFAKDSWMKVLFGSSQVSKLVMSTQYFFWADTIPEVPQQRVMIRSIFRFGSGSLWTFLTSPLWSFCRRPVKPSDGCSSVLDCSIFPTLLVLTI